MPPILRLGADHLSDNYQLIGTIGIQHRVYRGVHRLCLFNQIGLPHIRSRRIVGDAERQSEKQRMSNLLIIAAVLVVAFLASLLITPIVRRLALACGIVDRPDPLRKLHGRVVARAGGAAVLLSMLVGCLVAFVVAFRMDRIPADAWISYGGILAVMIGICALGLADDIWGLRGRQKLFGQFVLASFLAFTGYLIDHIDILGQTVSLGYLALPVTVIWLLATTNALNLIDGSDGFCAMIGAIICGSLAVMAAYYGNLAEAAIAIAMCGALLGFLYFNFPPASIFLGDSGSLLIGLITGALAIRCSLKGPATVALLAPASLLVIPLFDSAMAILRRKLTGRSIFTTDRAHIHHTLKNYGFSDKGLLAIAAAMCLFVSLGAISGLWFKSELLALGSASTVVAILIASKIFGFAEMSLLARRVGHFAASMLEPARGSGQKIHQKAVRLQGTRSWELIWATLTEFAERQQLSKVHLDLNVPWLHEGFHATWQRSRMPDRLERWSTSLPLYADGRLAGRLDVVGPVADGKAFHALSQLAEILEDMGPQLEALVASSTNEPMIKLAIPQKEESEIEASIPSRAS